MVGGLIKKDKLNTKVVEAGTAVVKNEGSNRNCPITLVLTVVLMYVLPLVTLILTEDVLIDGV